MNLLFNTLLNSKQLNLDNENIDLKQVCEKLYEETKETKIAINKFISEDSEENLRQITLETYDIIQVCILILYKIHKEATSRKLKNFITRCNAEHIQKLNRRGWQPKHDILIKILDRRF